MGRVAELSPLGVASRAMFILTLIAALSVVLSAVARRSGASRWLAVGLPVLPALVAFIFFAIRTDIAIGPHGGIVPAWVVAGILLLVIVFIGFFTARFVRGRES